MAFADSHALELGTGDPRAQVPATASLEFPVGRHAHEEHSVGGARVRNAAPLEADGRQAPVPGLGEPIVRQSRETAGRILEGGLIPALPGNVGQQKGAGSRAHGNGDHQGHRPPQQIGRRVSVTGRPP